MYIRIAAGSLAQRCCGRSSTEAWWTFVQLLQGLTVQTLASLLLLKWSLPDFTAAWMCILHIWNKRELWKCLKIKRVTIMPHVSSELPFFTCEQWKLSSSAKKKKKEKSDNVSWEQFNSQAIAAFRDVLTGFWLIIIKQNPIINNV